MSRASKYLKIFAYTYLIFLYAPALLLPIFSFNSSQIISFPLTGFTQVKYDNELSRIVTEPVKLDQEYRNFDYNSPWQGTEYIKEIKKNDE